jgi:hypothetical protein
MRSLSGDWHSSDISSMVTPVITSLLLWLVDDMTTHRGNEHHAAASISLHHVISNCLGADEGSGQVNVKPIDPGGSAGTRELANCLAA